MWVKIWILFVSSENENWTQYELGAKQHVDLSCWKLISQKKKMSIACAHLV